MESLTLQIAGKSYTIHSLTGEQLEALHVGVVRELPKGEAADTLPATYQRHYEIIALALAESHPEMTIEALRKLRWGTVKAVRDAADEVLYFSGIIDRPKPGEAPPAGESPAAAA